MSILFVVAFIEVNGCLLVTQHKTRFFEEPDSMNQQKQTSITQSKNRWLSRWLEPETIPAVLPRSKTGQLALRAKLANIDAERAVERAYQAEILRAKAITDAMFKSGKALKYSIRSSMRQILLYTESARRSFEPGYRN